MAKKKTVKKTTKKKTGTKKKSAKKKTSGKNKAVKTFLVTYHSPASAMKKMMTASQEEKEAGMAEWMKWSAKCGSSLVDMGAPLMGGLNMKSSGAPTPSKRKVTGYSILQCESMAAAKKLLKGHPHLAWVKGCEIEVHESIPLG